MTVHPASRRAFLTSAAVAPAFAALGSTSASAALAPDPLPRLFADFLQTRGEWRRRIDADDDDETPEMAALWDESVRLGKLIETTAATTPEGLAAQIGLILEDYRDGHSSTPIKTVSDVPSVFLNTILAGLKEISR